MVNYYELLGVSRSASYEDIRKAFRGLMNKIHPDHNSNDKASESMTKLLNEAHDTLKNEKKRKEYDNTYFNASTAEAPEVNTASAGAYENTQTAGASDNRMFDSRTRWSFVRVGALAVLLVGLLALYMMSDILRAFPSVPFDPGVIWKEIKYFWIPIALGSFAFIWFASHEARTNWNFRIGRSSFKRRFIVLGIIFFTAAYLIFPEILSYETVIRKQYYSETQKLPLTFFAAAKNFLRDVSGTSWVNIIFGVIVEDFFVYYIWLPLILSLGYAWAIGKYGYAETIYQTCKWIGMAAVAVVTFMGILFGVEQKAAKRVNKMTEDIWNGS